LRTSSVHRIISENVVGTTATLTAMSDIMDPEFRAAVDGHNMNGHGVATSVRYALSLCIMLDFALTLI
jgi:hypothetical protein